MAGKGRSSITRSPWGRRYDRRQGPGAHLWAELDDALALGAAQQRLLLEGRLEQPVETRQLIARDVARVHRERKLVVLDLDARHAREVRLELGERHLDRGQQLVRERVVEGRAGGADDLEAVRAGKVEPVEVDPATQLLERAPRDDRGRVAVGKLREQRLGARRQTRRRGVGHRRRERAWVRVRATARARVRAKVRVL